MTYYYAVPETFGSAAIQDLLVSKSKKVKKYFRHEEKISLVKSLHDNTEFLPAELIDKNSILDLSLSLLNCNIDDWTVEQKFQTFMLMCFAPDMFMGDTRLFGQCENTDYIPRKFSKNKKKLIKFNQKLDAFFHEMYLYQSYVNRATKELDRDVNKPRFVNKLNVICDDLSAVYKAYYEKVRRVISNASSKCPSINKRLLEHCITNCWLLPFAHIILIRDAKYQITGNVKYSLITLLKAESKNVFGAGISPEYATLIASETNWACLIILDILETHLNDEITTRPVSEFSKAAKKHIFEYSERLTVNGALDFVYQFYNLQKLQELDVKHDATPFAVPDYDTASLTAIIGIKFQIKSSQINNLSKFLSIDLLKRVNIRKELIATGLQPEKKRT